VHLTADLLAVSENEDVSNLAVIAEVEVGTGLAVRVSRVVIVGGGFGGIEAARSLADAPVSITLIDRKNHFCFQPLLYQVATASLAAPDVTWPIRSILAEQLNAAVIMNEVDGVDTEHQSVHCSDGRTYPYDFLILATGSTHAYFGHEAWEAVAPGLKTIEDATEIRSRMLAAFERAEAADTLMERQSNLTFVVIGGGPTGVEMAGAIADIARTIINADFRNIRRGRANVVLIEAGSRLLGAFPEELSRYAAEQLGDMEVDVRLGAAVTDCNEDGVTTNDGVFIPARTIIWAAGVRASPAAKWLSAEADKAGRVRVDEHLRVSGHERIFAVGDTSASVQEGRAVPGLAPAAKQMGRYVGSMIREQVSATPRSVLPFRYRHEGDLATIGRGAAIVSRGRLRLIGFTGWMFWGIAHVYFLIERRSRLLVAMNWLFEYVTRKRGARIISS
jgi:NADH dehydrogenase